MFYTCSFIAQLSVVNELLASGLFGYCCFSRSRQYDTCSPDVWQSTNPVHRPGDLCDGAGKQSEQGRARSARGECNNNKRANTDSPRAWTPGGGERGRAGSDKRVDETAVSRYIVQTIERERERLVEIDNYSERATSRGRVFVAGSLAKPRALV